MLVSNLETAPGHRIVSHLGIAQGSTVRAKHMGRDFMSGLKNIVGGELKAYTELMQEARDEAVRTLSASLSGTEVVLVKASRGGRLERVAHALLGA